MYRDASGLALIHADGADNITVTGEPSGTVNGNGPVWWECWSGDRHDPPCGDENRIFHSRPHLVMLVRGNDIVFANITVEDSPNWTLHFAWITSLHVYGVRVHNVLPSGKGGPNADGIGIGCSQDVLVETNYFDVGDDALCHERCVSSRGSTITAESLAGHKKTYCSEIM
jgi:polygalacturonase